LTVDYRHRVNICGIRTALDRIWRLTIPVTQENLIADISMVDNKIPWRDQMCDDVKRAYVGLPGADAARSLVRNSFKGVRSDGWLVDYLFNAFLLSLEQIHWKPRDVFRGDSHQRARYKNESEYILNLCLEAEIDRLIVGYRQRHRLGIKLFESNGVRLEVQEWEETQAMQSRDSILDVIARHGTENIEALF